MLEIVAYDCVEIYWSVENRDLIYYLCFRNLSKIGFWADNNLSKKLGKSSLDLRGCAVCTQSSGVFIWNSEI